MVDVGQALKSVMTKGKVTLGARQTKRAIEKETAKLIVVTKNCLSADDISTAAIEKKIPLYAYNAKSIELGHLCGKNFPVSAFAVLDEGESNIMQLVAKKRKER